MPDSDKQDILALSSVFEEFLKTSQVVTETMTKFHTKKEIIEYLMAVRGQIDTIMRMVDIK